MPQTPNLRLVDRALLLMRLHGEEPKYAGLGLWSYGRYESGRLRIVHNADCLGIRLDGLSVYLLDTVSGREDETIGPHLSVQEAMREIDRVLLLDDLSAIADAPVES